LDFDFSNIPLMEPDYVKLRDIKPALSGYISEARSLLRLALVPDDRVVHDIRVLMKKSRAVMRLIISQINEEFYNREYGTFREIGRIMSLWRDTSVHRKTLKDLKKTHSGIFPRLADNEKIEKLLRKTDSPAEPSPDLKADLEKISELLDKSGYRIRFQTMNNFDPKLLLKEIDTSYNIAADRYMVCRNTLKPTDIHEFRKRSKDFLYQLWFFRPLNPRRVKSLEKRLDALAQNLGKYNDLAQLITELGYKYKDSADSPAFDELILIIREEQDRYLSKVWPQAYRIFCPGQKLISLLGFKVLMI
jgi:CHAD domain-containing protein